jgi:tetratricopeptide (TPR) repeat protein
MEQKSSAALEVANAIAKAMSLAGRDLYDAVWQILKKAEQVATNANLSSGHLCWGLAVAADQRQDAPNAVKYIMRALRLDPAAPPFLHSYDLIRGHLLTTFKEMDATDTAVPIFFRLIADLNAVDATVLIKYSRHLVAEGNHEAALGLAQDAVQREPRNAEVLRHLARLLARAGRYQEARARRSEAEALAVTFPCPAAQA